MTTQAASILVANALHSAVGQNLTCTRTPTAFKDTLLATRKADAPDAWVILGRFERDKRGRSEWLAASGVMIDLDYEDPALPRNEGTHQDLPESLQSRIATALAEFGLPGFAYLTRRGMRWACVLTRDVSDTGTYSELVACAAQRLMDHLRDWGIPLWRDGVTGLRYDSVSAKPWQPMRLPLPGVPILLTGDDCPICPTDLLGGDVPRLNIAEALPPDFAASCMQVGRWIQVSPEVVVTNLMAAASAAIGNSRWVTTRGFSIPLSLHYLTVLPSGSGKSTVRKFMRRATEGIQREIQEQRSKAAKEHQEYSEKLNVWLSDRRSQKNRNKAGERPRPPALSPLGGPRVTYTVSEGTLEGIIATLEDSPRGILWASDEAHEVLGLLGRYGDGKGARSLDAARLRRLMQSEPVEAHRARGNAEAIRKLPRPWLGIDADVQPGVFAKLFTEEDRVSGMSARFLAHSPPSMQGRRQYVQPTPEPDPWVLELFRTRLFDLWAIPLEIRDETPWFNPLPLDSDAERLWAEELEALERRYPNADDEEVGMLGHARGRILRLAGVLALLRDPRATHVTEIDIRQGITHMRYHLAQHQWQVRQLEGSSDRREKLRQRVQQIFDRQKETGVRPSDLRNNVNKASYGGPTGERRALADMHALGWDLRRPKAPAGRPGRRPVPAFFPPAPGVLSGKSAKPAGRERVADLADHPAARRGENGADARTLLEDAGARLTEAGLVELPRPGVRVECPACGSPDGLGTIPEAPSRWYCHSDRHSGPRGGVAVDYLLAQQLGRMPSVEEAVEEAKAILGGGPPESQRFDGEPEAKELDDDGGQP